MGRKPRIKTAVLGRVKVASSKYGVRTERIIHLESLGALARTINIDRNVYEEPKTH